jgi:hypothetical protein
VKGKAEGLVAGLELKINDLTAKIVFKRDELQTRRDDRYDIHVCLSCMMMMMMFTETNYKRGVLKNLSSTCET